MGHIQGRSRHTHNHQGLHKKNPQRNTKLVRQGLLFPNVRDQSASPCCKKLQNAIEYLNCIKVSQNSEDLLVGGTSQAALLAAVTMNITGAMVICLKPDSMAAAPIME